MADPDDEGRDIWETVMSNPVFMGGAGVVGGALVGKKVGSFLKRKRPTRLKLWKEQFRKSNGRKPTRDEIEDFKMDDRADNGPSYDDRMTGDGPPVGYSGASKLRRAIRGNNPTSFGATAGGAAGVGYSQGRRNRK